MTSYLNKDAFTSTYPDIYPRVIADLSPTDQMFAGNHQHYLSVGESALKAIQHACEIAGLPEPQRILDFGAGSGRVTRWIRAAFPKAHIVVADVRGPCLKFNAATFDAEPWAASTDLRALEAPGMFDLIWAGSVATHLPKNSTFALVRKFRDWTKPNGVFSYSVHGRFVQTRILEGERDYGLSEEGIKALLAGFDDGYGYADYPNQLGYGISICRPDWTIGHAATLSGTSIVSYSERAWDNHQDVIALKVRDNRK